MTVDEAIDNLKDAKKRGVKSIVMAYWEADQFDREDNEAWEYDSEFVERKMDWSETYDDIALLLDMIANQ